MSVFDKIKTESDRLAAADDRISAFLKQTEARLQALQPGIQSEFVWRDPDGFRNSLTYEKEGKVWQIMFASEDHPRPTPLGATPRDIRASVVTALANGKTPLEHLLEQIATDLADQNAARSAVITHLEKGGR